MNLQKSVVCSVVLSDAIWYSFLHLLLSTLFFSADKFVHNPLQHCLIICQHYNNFVSGNMCCKTMEYWIYCVVADWCRNLYSYSESNSSLTLCCASREYWEIILKTLDVWSFSTWSLSISFKFIILFYFSDLVSFTLKEMGKIDYLVNNGGGQFVSTVANMKVKGWNAVIDTNLNGTFHMCKEGVFGSICTFYMS